MLQLPWKKTGLGVALQILPAKSNPTRRQRVPSPQSWWRGAEEAVPAEKADPALPSAGCRWLVEHDLGANGGWFEAQQLRSVSGTSCPCLAPSPAVIFTTIACR